MSAKMMPQRKPRFSEAIKTKGYQSLIYNTLGDPSRAQRFIASITSAVAVNGQLQECDAGSILAGALLGESLGLQPSPQLGQYYLVPFDCKVKGPDGKALYKTDENGNKLKDAKGHWIAVTEKKAQFVLGYHGYIQLALRTGQYRDMGVVEIRQGEYLGRDPSTGKPRFQFEEDDSRRMELLAERLKTFQVDGVVEIDLQACTPYCVESFWTRQAAEAAGVPYLALETDYSQADGGQLSTRLEAFLEILE